MGASLLCLNGWATDVTVSKDRMMDKIKGAWAGQTIGCTYGGPTEFRYRAEMIPDDVAIEWNEGQIKWYFDNQPGLYDDVYMDLTFLNTLYEKGINASAKSFADEYAHAEYPLWHANQAGRYNVLRGIYPPQSGHWKNNPHADCIDYQIEADYAGIITPGMPNSASKISDKVGHIMNYGDGWYGGVFVGAMYSLAYLYDDVETVVCKALLTIPAKSKFRKAIEDVIQWHHEYPSDWKKNWQLVQEKYDHDFACSYGVNEPYNIDALINSAYIVIGLLYGEGDFDKTLEISTRCGQDSDCNPASAGGVLGTILGYDKIPQKWLANLHEVENLNFAYTQISLNRAYEYSMQLAARFITKNGGKDNGASFTIREQKPKAVRFEESFPHIQFKESLPGGPIQSFGTKHFVGNGYMVNGEVRCGDPKYVADLEIYIDGKLKDTMHCPVSYHDRTQELCWHYTLKQGPHEWTIKWVNPREDAEVICWKVITYSRK